MPHEGIWQLRTQRIRSFGQPPMFVGACVPVLEMTYQDIVFGVMYRRFGRPGMSPDPPSPDMSSTGATD